MKRFALLVMACGLGTACVERNYGTDSAANVKESAPTTWSHVNTALKSRNIDIKVDYLFSTKQDSTCLSCPSTRVATPVWINVYGANANSKARLVFLNYRNAPEYLNTRIRHSPDFSPEICMI